MRGATESQGSRDLGSWKSPVPISGIDINLSFLIPRHVDPSRAAWTQEKFRRKIAAHTCRRPPSVSLVEVGVQVSSTRSSIVAAFFLKVIQQGAVDLVSPTAVIIRDVLYTTFIEWHLAEEYEELVEQIIFGGMIL